MHRAGIQGFPTNTKLETEMEDFGVSDNFKDEYAKYNQDDNKEQETMDCIGDWWIDEDHPMQDNTRLLFFVKWIGLYYSVLT